MNDPMPILAKHIHAALITLLLAVVSVTAGCTKKHSDAVGIGQVTEFESEVIAIDQQTRELILAVSLLGLTNTAFVPKSLNLEDISIGDRVAGTYIAAANTDLRTPTQEELADPWVVLEEGALTADGKVATAHRVRAVVTILTSDEEKGLIVVKDSRGRMHFIINVDPDKAADISRGGQVVVFFTEAMALTLAIES